jgi:WXG100 family type VII secretion target
VFVNRLDPVELTRIAGEFDNNRDAITNALSKFEAEVGVIAAKWTGRAGMSFQNVAENWRQLQKALVDLLTETANDVRTVAGTSRAASEAAAAAIKIELPLDTRGA